jgi:hypothetical protein
VSVPDGFYPQCCAETLTQDRTELAGTVANRIVCAWLDRFFTAPEGSTQAAEALDAIASIPSWPVTAEVAEAAANPVEGYIPTGSANIFAAMLCDPNARG